MNEHSLLRKAILALAALGAALMAYLTYLHYAPEAVSFCDLGEYFSCDLVNKSFYSEFLGIGVSIPGFLYFASIFYIFWRSKDRDTYVLSAFLTIIALVPSLYLTIGVSALALQKYCLYCETSKIVMALILGLSLKGAGLRYFGAGRAVFSLIIGLALAGMFFAWHQQLDPGDRYAAFAQCLTDKSYVMYGSAGCSFCARQRLMFGEGFQNIQEVECDARFEGAIPELCVAKNITHTPTWIQEDASGNTLYRFEDGIVALEDLSAQSGCPLEPAEEIIQ